MKIARGLILDCVPEVGVIDVAIVVSVADGVCGLLNEAVELGGGLLRDVVVLAAVPASVFVIAGHVWA